MKSYIRHITFTLPLLAGAITAGFYLAPNRKEMALMQMSDAHFGDALRHYTSLWDKGDHSINVLAPLINLHVHYGDIDTAIAMMRDYVAQHPSSFEGHKQLASLYKSSQRFHHYCPRPNGRRS